MRIRFLCIDLWDTHLGPTLSSNGGVFGSLYGTPIINLPQAAVLGTYNTPDRLVLSTMRTPYFLPPVHNCRLLRTRLR